MALRRLTAPVLAPAACVFLALGVGPALAGPTAAQIPRTGAPANSNFDLDGKDDYRVDADIVVLDAGMPLEPEDFNLSGQADCVNPDPWRESLEEYEHPEGEPGWAPDETLNEAAEELPFGPFGCLEGAGQPLAGQLSGVHAARLAEVAAQYDAGDLGVAPGARIWNVRALADQLNFGAYPDPESTDPEDPDYLPALGTAHVVAGLRWAVEHADEIEVVEMATDCARIELETAPVECDDTTLDEAIAAAIDAGIVIVVAAGNSGADSALGTPRDNPEVLTVSNVADFDDLAGGTGGVSECAEDPEQPDDVLDADSAFGPVVDLAAPTECAGTSAASAQVAGAVAALASQCDPDSREDVEFIVDTLMAEGETGEIEEGGWSDDSGDGWKEPLLNLFDEEVFDPVLIDTETEEKEPADPEGCEWRSHQAEQDVDYDGRADLVAITAEGTAMVYPGTPQGFDAQDPTTSLWGDVDPALTDGAGHYAIDTADVDGDRHADLVTIDGDGDVWVHRGQKSGRFAAATPAAEDLKVSMNGSGPIEPIAVADVDGDERGDLIALLGPPSPGYVLTFPGQADGSFGSPLSSALAIDPALQDGEGEYFLDAIDVTGEELDEPQAEPIDYNEKHSNADLVTVSTEGTVYVYEGKDNGKFATAPIEAAEMDPILDDGEGEEPIGLGEVDRDRRADLLSLEGSTLRLRRAHLDLQSGEFSFEAPSEAYEGEIDSSLTDGEGEEPIALLDYSRDGLADLVSLSEEGTLLTYTAQRDKTFAEPLAAAGTIETVRQEAGGQELLAERPFPKRPGCTEAGCAWLVPPHTPRFEAGGFAYPAEVSGGGIDTFQTWNSTFLCGQAGLEGTLAGLGPTLALDPSADECEETVVGLETTVAMNSCGYELGLRNAEPLSAHLGVACDEEGDKIEYEVHLGGSVICRAKIGPQQGLDGVEVANAGEGAEAELELDIEAQDVAYELQGGGCGQKTGSFEDGSLSGQATLSAEAQEEAVGLLVSGEELPLGLYLTGEESEEEAEQPRFEAESQPLHVAGGGIESLVTEAGTFDCEAVTLSGQLASAADLLALQGAHDGCTVPVEEASAEVSVLMNSCHYTLEAQSSDPPTYSGAIGVACEEEGDAIELKVHVGEWVLNCAKLPPQDPVSGVELSNTGQAAERAVSIDAQAEGLEYEQIGVCGEGETKTDGVLSGEGTLRGVG